MSIRSCSSTTARRRSGGSPEPDRDSRVGSFDPRGALRQAGDGWRLNCLEILFDKENVWEKSTWVV